MKLKVFSLFAGYGTDHFALKRLGIDYENVGFSEIDKYAIKCFKNNHGGNNYGNVREINPNDIPDMDLLTAGFPCSPKGTLIRTQRGYVKIEEIGENDFVLTHKNQYRQVINTMNRISNHIYHIKSVGVYDLELTENHPIYSYKNNKFQWIKVKDLKEGDYVSFNINQNEKNEFCLTEQECWLMGRYCADGCIEKDNRKRLYFCIGKNKSKEFLNKIKNYEYFVCHKERNCKEYFIKNKRLKELCELCKIGAKNKVIPSFIIDLPIGLLQCFFDGYISGDGHYRKDRDCLMYSTVSKKMCFGLQEIVIKLYNKIPTITLRIDNRKKTFNDSYNCQICLYEKKQRHSFIIGDKIFGKIKQITKKEKEIEVYNIEVEEDNSYTCYNVITHNCQAFSTAGNMLGELDTRGTLFYEIIRIAEVKKPKYILLENVKGLTFKKFKPTFDKILSELDRIGYKVYWKVLNSKDYGTPQNRERVWFVCIRKDINQEFIFPEKQELNIFIKDLLLDEVDKKYILNESQIKTLMRRFGAKGKLLDLDKDNEIPTLTTVMSSGVGNVPYITNVAPREVGFKERCPALCARDYKEPKVVLYDAKTLGGNEEVCHTIRSGSGSGNNIYVENIILRKLTPIECFRFMGFFNDEINLEDLSDTQRYKLAGNGQDVIVVYLILKNLIPIEYLIE